MLRSAPPQPPAKNLAEASAYLLCVCVATLVLIAGSLGAWADGAAPQNVAHLVAFLGLGGAAALIAWAAGIPGIYPPRSDRLALVTNCLTAVAGIEIFFTKVISGPVQRARRRAWRMKP